MAKKKKFKTHKIRNFQDLQNVCTPENIDAVFADFYGAFKMFIELNKCAGVVYKGFDWTDDGETTVTGIDIIIEK